MTFCYEVSACTLLWRSIGRYHYTTRGETLTNELKTLILNVNKCYFVHRLRQLFALLLLLAIDRSLFAL